MTTAFEERNRRTRLAQHDDGHHADHEWRPQRQTVGGHHGQAQANRQPQYRFVSPVHQPPISRDRRGSSSA